MKTEEMTESVTAALTTLYSKLAAFIPNLIAAIIVLVAGYFIAKFIGFLLSKILEKLGVDKLSNKIGLKKFLAKASVKIELSSLIGAIIFWMFLLTFLITAAETLGLDRVSSTIDEFVFYIPKIIGAIIIVVIGLAVGHFLKNAIRTTAEEYSLSYARALGSAVQAIVILIVCTLGIGQLEIETQLLDYIISILMVAVGASVALSLGFGTRDVSGRIISGVYARELFKTGDNITVGAVSGEIIEIGTVKTRIENANGDQVSISNDVLIKEEVNVKKKKTKTAKKA
ncbi:MAG: hypothetical protein ACI9KN_000618 [Gammaproteobacteria bacterium]|jgi:hypothetical protein